jgi:hypothetical protein
MKKLQTIEKILEGMSQKARFYWVHSMVKLGDITTSEAGYLLSR